MPVYTVSPDLLRNIDKDDGLYFTDILFVFTQRNNPFKVAKDKFGLIIDCYQQINNNGDIIKTWLDLMSFKPSSFETIDVDLSKIDCEETMFMKVCRETKSQNKLIVYTTQNLNKFHCNNNIVHFEDTAIQILDRDIARGELFVASKIGDTYINSQVAKENSQITKSQNK